MALKDTLISNNSIIDTKLTIIDDALTATTITQARHDELYNGLNAIKTNNTNMINSLNTNIGSKSAGNYSSLDEVVNDKCKAVQEAMRAYNKYNAGGTGVLDINSAIEALQTLDNYDITFPIFGDTIADIEAWYDANYAGYYSDVLAHKAIFDSIETKMTSIKNNVTTFIGSVLTLSGNINASLLLNTNTPQSIIDLMLGCKSTQEQTLINNLHTSTDKASIIKSQIDSFKI